MCPVSAGIGTQKSRDGGHSMIEIMKNLPDLDRTNDETARLPNALPTKLFPPSEFAQAHAWIIAAS
jgi:hypothetical protein